jgi:hypothetical protein
LQESYVYDSIGNRLTAVQDAARTSYTPNAVNQYSAINPAGLGPLVPVHDGNGNLTADGQGRSMSWSTEDRLKAITDSNPAAGSGGRSSEFVYDAMGRRIRSIHSTGTGPAKAEHHSTLYLYDGWSRAEGPEVRQTLQSNGPQDRVRERSGRVNVIAEYQNSALPNSSFILHNSFSWGLDLSNTPQGAGGVGGLLATKQHTTSPVVLYPAYDGNGNITQATDTPQ